MFVAWHFPELTFWSPWYQALIRVWWKMIVHPKTTSQMILPKMTLALLRWCLFRYDSNIWWYKKNRWFWIWLLHDNLFLQIDLWYDTKHLPSWPLKPRPLWSASSCEAWNAPVPGEEFRTISSASTMLLGQVTKALKNGPPFGVFLHVPKVPSNEPKVCAPRRPGGFKVFLEAGLQLPLPPKKVATGPMPAKHWKECLVLVQKGMAGQDCHGLYFKMVFFVKLMSS